MLLDDVMFMLFAFKKEQRCERINKGCRGVKERSKVVEGNEQRMKAVEGGLLREGCSLHVKNSLVAFIKYFKMYLLHPDAMPVQSHEKSLGLD